MNFVYEAYCATCDQRGRFTEDAPKEFLDNPRCPNGHKVELKKLMEK